MSENKILSTKARFAQILSILNKHKVQKGIDPIKLRLVLEDLGPTFVKIGQIMSTRQDMFSERYCKELMKLRSNVTPLPFSTIESILKDTYGDHFSQIFSCIDQVPLGSASIAQVHSATLSNGDKVVLKVQRPHIYEAMERDVNLLRKAVRFLNLSDIISSVVDLDTVIDEFWFTAQQEMDFTNEAKFANKFRETYKACDYIDAPKIYDEYTKKHVLVLEFIDGIDITNKEQLLNAGYNLHDIADKLAYNFLTQIIEHGFFHADPHSGNLRIRDNRIVWIDFGMMGILDQRDRELMKNAVKAIIFHDTSRLVDIILTLGIYSQEIDYPHFSNDIERFMNRYLSISLDEIDLAKMVQDMFTICHQHHISLPKGISMLARGLLTMESTLIGLDPKMSMMKIVTSHKSTFTQFDLFKEIKEYTKRSFEAVNRSLDLPVQSSDVLKLIQRGQIKVNLNLLGSDQPIAKIDRMVNRMIICILIAALFVGSSLLCTTSMEPKILGIPMLGFFGFIVALAMSIWLFMKMLMLHKRNKSF